MIATHKQNLDTLIKHCSDWYDSYSSHTNPRIETIVITPVTHPNPLEQRPSIYPRKVVFDGVTSVAKEYYEERGIRTIVSGPEGLGATGGESLSTFTQWIIDNKDFLRFAPMISTISKRVYGRYRRHKEGRRLMALRAVKYQIGLSIDLYFEDKDQEADIVVYLQQLLTSYLVLARQLEHRVPQADVYVSFRVLDLVSDRYAETHLESMNNESVITAIVSKLNRESSSLNNISVSVGKNFFGGLRLKVSRNR